MGGESSPKDRDAPPLLCRRRHHLQSQPEAVSQRKGRSPSLTRHRFEAYLDKVFGFSDLVSALPEGRQFPQHAWKRCSTPSSWPPRCRFPACCRLRPSVAMARWPNASDRSVTTPSATRSKDKLLNPCSRSVVKLLAA